MQEEPWRNHGRRITEEEHEAGNIDEESCGTAPWRRSRESWRNFEGSTTRRDSGAIFKKSTGICKQFGCVRKHLRHLKAHGDNWETPRRHLAPRRHPVDTLETPRRNPGGTQETPRCTQEAPRKLPRDSQRDPGRIQKARGNFKCDPSARVQTASVSNYLQV